MTSKLSFVLISPKCPNDYVTSVLSSGWQSTGEEESPVSFSFVELLEWNLFCIFVGVLWIA